MEIFQTLRGIGLEPSVILLSVAVGWLARELTNVYKAWLAAEQSRNDKLTATLERSSEAIEHLTDRIEGRR